MEVEEFEEALVDGGFIGGSGCGAVGDGEFDGEADEAIDGEW